MTSLSSGESEKRREEKRETVLNTVLNTAKTRYVSSFSVPPEDLGILHDFEKIAKREAGSRGFSRVLVRGAMAEYNKHHSFGNPQLLITNYSLPESPQPLKVLCNMINGALSEGKVFCRKAGMWIPGVRCYSCQNNKLRKAEKK